MKRVLNELMDFFRDEKGNNSMTRLCTLILVVGGLIYAYTHVDYIGGLAIATLGMSGKIVQKKLSETK